MEKHSSLLQKSINYGHKKFYSTGPWSKGYIKLFMAVVVAIVFSTLIHIHPSIIFAGKARSQPLEWSLLSAYAKVRRSKLAAWFIVLRTRVKCYKWDYLLKRVNFQDFIGMKFSWHSYCDTLLVAPYIINAHL
jgi:hypothetical protein